MTERVADEVGELGEPLDARVARADEHEREVPTAVGLADFRGRGLEFAQDVVAQVDRVGQVLERERVLLEPGHRECPRHGAERDDEALPADFERAGVGLDVDGPCLLVQLGRAAEQELRVRAHQAQRDDDVTRLERSGRRLREDRRVEHEVSRLTIVAPSRPRSRAT